MTVRTDPPPPGNQAVAEREHALAPRGPVYFVQELLKLMADKSINRHAVSRSLDLGPACHAFVRPSGTVYFVPTTNQAPPEQEPTNP